MAQPGTQRLDPREDSETTNPLCDGVTQFTPIDLTIDFKTHLFYCTQVQFEPIFYCFSKQADYVIGRVFRLDASNRILICNALVEAEYYFSHVGDTAFDSLI